MTLESDSRNLLLALAFESIEAGLTGTGPGHPPAGTLPAAVRDPTASFVTATVTQDLRGCCGTLDPYRSLVEDVWENAYASAFRDTRFGGIRREDLATLEIEIAVLGPLEPMAVSSEQDLLNQLVPGEDGLVLERDTERVTFLPKVWDGVVDATEFVEHLKIKGGWDSDKWSSGFKCFRYRTECFAAAYDAFSELGAGQPL